MEDLKIARYCVGIDIYDNDTGEDVFHEGINLNSKNAVIGLLEDAIDKIRNS